MSGTPDPHDLQRFVDAQDDLRTYDTALAELRAGRKRSHWMWFVLPQLAGLGMSSTAQHFGIHGLAEARAYLAHPVLGPRLRDCAGALADLDTADPVAVLGPVDALKLRSSMTLFARAEPGEPVFRQVLEQYYDGAEDPATVSLLGPLSATSRGGRSWKTSVSSRSEPPRTTTQCSRATLRAHCSSLAPALAMTCRWLRCSLRPCTMRNATDEVSTVSPIWSSGTPRR